LHKLYIELPYPAKNINDDLVVGAPSLRPSTSSGPGQALARLMA